jgi:hypothetical protein
MPYDFRFPLSLRLVEEMLLERGIVVSYETIRRWAIKFGADRPSAPHDQRTRVRFAIHLRVRRRQKGAHGRNGERLAARHSATALSLLSAAADHADYCSALGGASAEGLTPLTRKGPTYTRKRAAAFVPAGNLATTFIVCVVVFEGRHRRIRRHAVAVFALPVFGLMTENARIHRNCRSCYRFLPFPFSRSTCEFSAEAV